MAEMHGVVGRLLALTIAIVLFVPLVWVLLVLPVLGAFGVSTEAMSSIGWLVALAVGISVGYVLYRDLLVARPALPDENERTGQGENRDE